MTERYLNDIESVEKENTVENVDVENEKECRKENEKECRKEMVDESVENVDSVDGVQGANEDRRDEQDDDGGKVDDEEAAESVDVSQQEEEQDANQDMESSEFKTPEKLKTEQEQPDTPQKDEECTPPPISPSNISSDFDSLYVHGDPLDSKNPLDDVSDIPSFTEHEITDSGISSTSMYDFEEDTELWPSEFDNMNSQTDLDILTLEDCLEKDHVVQDVQLSNPRVINAITQKEESFVQFVNYISNAHYVDERKPLNTIPQGDILRYFKYPYIVQQILSVQHDSINRKIVKSPKLLETLFSYIQSIERGRIPMNEALPDYFVKSISILVRDYYVEISTYLKQVQKDNLDILKSLIDNLDNFNMDSLLLKLLGFDSGEDNISGWHEMRYMETSEPDENVEKEKEEMKSWAVERGIAKYILEKIQNPNTPESIHEALFSTLSTILEDPSNPISKAILQKDFIGQVIEFCLSKRDTETFHHGMVFLRTIIEVSEKPDENEIPEALHEIVERTKDIAALLDEIPEHSFNVPHGPCNPPLGEKRLRVVEHLKLLFNRNNPKIFKILKDLQIPEKIIELFFMYEYNSMLHFHCTVIFKTLMQTDNDEILKYLWINTKLLPKIIESWKKNEESHHRLGYMGHIIILGSEIQKKVDLCAPDLAEFCTQQEDWKDFVEFLRNERKKQEVALGGRL